MVLDKLDLFFGDVLSVEELYRRFYTAEQTDKELVGTWALRVENLYSDLVKKDPTIAVAETKEKMLRSRFFMGLLPEHISLVKAKLRHKYDAGATYYMLVIDARTAELEQQGTKARAKVQQESVVIDQGLGKKLDMVLAQLSKVDELSERMKKMEEREQGRDEKKTGPFKGGHPKQTYSKPAYSQDVRRQFPGKCFECGQVGHKRDSCPGN
jgi:hypothetical protein